MTSDTCALHSQRQSVFSDAIGPHNSGYVILKFFLEWGLAVALLIVTAPMIAFLALLVRLTSAGPAFYLQSRVGLGGRPFRIIKLRTMAHNCEAKTGAVWSLPGDKRVTRLGGVLRKTHLDELPQLVNVLMGNMALVGPRPERPEISAAIERVLPEFRERVRVRPGVTGLAQMRLPADTNLEGVRLKLAHDLYYVRELNFILDARVACCTAFYFLGAMASAVCDALVKSHSLAVQHSLPRLRELAKDEVEVKASEA